MTDKFPNIGKYNRLLGLNDDFMRSFHQNLIDSHPDVAEYFDGLDFTKRCNILRKSRDIAVHFAKGNDFARDYINTIRESNKRKGPWRIPPRLHRYWVDSLIQTIADHDSKFTAEIETEWREAMQVVIDFIQKEQGTQN